MRELALAAAFWQTGVMRVPEDLIAQVVCEASQQMTDPQYISGQVDELMALQPHLSGYVLAFQSELTVEGIVSLLFHASLINESIRRATGQHPRQVSFRELDEAVQATPDLETLGAKEPHLAAFIASNLVLDQGETASATAQRVLAHLTAALAG